MKVQFTFILMFLSFLLITSFTPNREVLLGYVKLHRTSIAQHIGDGDEELKSFDRVHLTGTFSLKLINGILFGVLFADFKEIPTGRGKNNIDGTEFTVNETYKIYEATDEYRIAGFKILYDKQRESYFDFMGRDWEQNDVILNGPLTAIHWVGDTGSDQDQIHGCFIEPYLRRIIVILEKK